MRFAVLVVCTGNNSDNVAMTIQCNASADYGAAHNISCDC